jgi:hypothetical protein
LSYPSAAEREANCQRNRNDGTQAPILADSPEHSDCADVRGGCFTRVTIRALQENNRIAGFRNIKHRVRLSAVRLLKNFSRRPSVVHVGNFYESIYRIHRHGRFGSPFGAYSSRGKQAMSDPERNWIEGEHGYFASTVAELVTGLRSDDLQERVDCAWALSNYGAEAEAAIPSIVAALDDVRNQENGRIMGYLCDTLRALSPNSRVAIPVLRKLLKSDDRAVSEEARKLLAFFENPSEYRADIRKNWFVAALVTLGLLLVVALIIVFVVRWLYFKWVSFYNVLWIGNTYTECLIRRREAPKL